MFIKQVIIDGFKSYANRTVINGWDATFNAITGLNGTGKSNILDAICFVLGISNLSQVRASNLQDLVYKQGQARVTKASVTIIFDNSDPKSGPVGYEQYNEITVTRIVIIGGKNKYLINGHNAQLSRVQNLFHSVQLNVNNPHFLIMQGRITKVCNMKPAELLSMIEEAAGTRMYESKKIGAQKTIQKKQSKVEEMNKILLEEITPTLEKLKKEKSGFIQWSANNTEIERLSRFCVAANFVGANEIVKGAAADVKKLLDEQREYEEEAVDIGKQIDALNTEVKEISQQKDEKLKKEFVTMEQAVSDLSKDLVKHTSVWTHKKENIASEDKNVMKMQNQLNEVTGLIEKKNAEVEEQKKKQDVAEDAYKKELDRVRNIESALLGVGMADGEKRADGEEGQGTLNSQLMAAQATLATAESEAKQAVMRSKHLTAQMNEKTKHTKAAEKEYLALQKNFDRKLMEKNAMDEKITQLTEKSKKFLSSGAANEKTASLSLSLSSPKLECEQKLKAAADCVSKLKEQISQLSVKLQKGQFSYTPPTKNFDVTRVKGMVAELVALKDDKAATAVEVAAGGKLYNVVVDTERTGKELLEKGQLKRRVTIIPLNKIAANSLRADVINKAENLVGKENVQSALSLVGYDKDLEAAMCYVFGNAFVCKDARSAEKVTFDKDIRTKSVTMNGDVFDPSGTLSGGSAPAAPILVQLTALAEMKKALVVEEQAYVRVDKELQEMNNLSLQLEDLQSSKSLLDHEVSVLKKSLEQSLFYQLDQERLKIELELELLQDTLSSAEKKQKECKEKCVVLEAQIKQYEKQREQQQKEFEKEMVTGKKKVAEKLKAKQKVDQESDCIRMELDQLTTEAETLKKTIAATKENIQVMIKEAEDMEANVADKKSKYDEVANELKKEKAALAEADKHLSQLAKQRARLTKTLNDNDLELKKLVHKISRVQGDAEDASKRVERMKKEFDWIAGEHHLFGQPNSDYDFERTKPAVAQKRLADLKKDQDKLGKTINKKVMGMYEKAEQEYDDLLKKRDIIEKDKRKIEEVIVELDIKKNQALETTWKKVNKDFGAIFGTLLPGTTAKLDPPSGASCLDGLEMKVAFGGVWKESLTELSGGQRSLLALSLILALLLFKPAPMYILDEIDAALDLSHTQNIGTMLKVHFPMSQFIVVSLKEGMFNNANVVFRTKFVDGVSAVTRTELNQKTK